MSKNKFQTSAKKSEETRVFKSRFTRLTRMMAAFTASLFLVSSNLAYAAPSGGGGGRHDVRNTAWGDMTRHQIRELKREARQELKDSIIRIPEHRNNRPILLGPPIKVDNNNGHRNPAHYLGPPIKQSGSGGKRHQNRIEKLSQFAAQNLPTGQLVRLDNGANLDLTVGDRNITLGDKLIKDGGFVTIEVGGEKKNLYAGSQVTAAEYIAAKQVLSGGEQKLVVDNSGAASGGTVDLNSIAASKDTMRADSLKVASGVTAVGDLAKNSSFRLSGDLDNYGSIYAVNTHGGRRGGEIAADNITNNEGALISSNAGSAYGNKSSVIDLSLNANGDFTNKGTVESSGDLSISAGNSVNNGSGSQITANGNVNLNSPQVTNAGTVSSANGDITLDTPKPQQLDVNNNGGTLEALNGAINVRAPSFDGAFDTNVVGGDLLSKQVNIQSGQGLATVDVGQLTGTVNSTGLAAHVYAATDNLVLGKQCLTGDPVYKNSAGNILLDGDISVGEALAILASGNVASTANLDLIEARDGGGVGQDIVIGAGWNILNGGGAGTNNGTIPPAIEATGNTNVFNGGATVGGNIDFTASTGLQILANGNNVDTAGGDVQLLARANSGNTVGMVLLNSDSVIDTSGVGAGANGNITVFAGRNFSGNSITLGSLNADGGASGGNITVRTAQPTAGGGVTFDADGNQTAGTFTAPATPVANAGILIGNNTGEFVIAGGNISIASGGFGTTLNLTGNVLESTLTGGNISVTSSGNGDTVINAESIDTEGGDVTVTAGGGVSLALPTGGINTTPIASGSGGDVLLRSDTNSDGTGSVLATNVDITTAGSVSGTGGSVTADVNGSFGVNQTVQVGDLDTRSAGGAGIASGAVNLHSGGGNVEVYNILAGNAGVAGTGALIDIDTNSNNGNIILEATNYVGSSIDLNTNGTGIITGLNGVNFQVDAFALNDNLNAAGQAVTIQTLTNGTVINVAGGAAGLAISTAELNRITANSLTIGNANSGSIAVLGSINVSGVGAGAFDLIFNTAGNLVAAPSDFTMGARNLTITAGVNITLDQVSQTTGLTTLDAGAAIATGALTTTTGNFNITSATNTTIGGTITASGGDVSIDAGGNVQTATMNGTTGDLVIASGGTTTIGQTLLTGAGSDIIIVSTGTINTLGSIQADPITLFSFTGAINLGGSVTANNGIVAIASGNIATTVAGVNIDASNAGGAGGPIVMVAGANFTLNPGTDVTINGASGTGGSLNLNASGGVSTIRSDSTGGAAGGNTTLVAFANGGSGGQVLLPGASSLITTGSGLNASGDVVVVAGATSGTGVQLGSVTTNSATNGLNGTGDVDIATTTPATGIAILLTAGNVGNYAGTFLGGATQNASVSAGAVTARGSDVNVLAGQNAGITSINVSASQANASGGNIAVETTGTDALDINLSAGSNFVGSVQANGGTTSGNGGNMTFTANGNTGINANPIAITVTDGNGGNLTLDAGLNGNISLNGGTYSVNAAGTNRDGGSISLTGNSLLIPGANVSLQANATGTGAVGGSLGIVTTNSANALNIGTGAGQFQIGVSGVNSFVNISSAGTINVANTGGFAATTIDLVTTGTGSDLNLSGNITATGVLTLIADDVMTVDGILTGTTVLAQADGDITGGGSLNGTTVSVTSTSGNIGVDAGNRLTVNSSAAGSLTAVANAGSVFIMDVDSVRFAASSALNTFDVQAGLGITQMGGGTINAADISLRSTGGTIDIDQQVTGTNSITLRSFNDMTALGANIVNAPNVSLTSDQGNIGAPLQRFQLQATNVTVNAPSGSAYLNDNTGLNIGAGSSVLGGTLDVIAGGLLSNTGTINADTVSLTGNALDFNASITATTSISVLSTLGITNADIPFGTLSAPQINLASNGSIGIDASNRFSIDATNLSAFSTFGSVFISDPNDVNLAGTASFALGTFDLLAGNNLTSSAGTGNVQANVVILRAQGGSLGLSGNVNGTTSVSLRANNSITSVATVTTPTLTVVSDNGNIGTSVPLGRLLVDVTNLTASAVNGFVSIEDTAGGVNLVNNGPITNQAQSNFLAVASGANADLTVTGTVSSTASTVNLSADRDIFVNNTVTAANAIGITANRNLASNATGTISGTNSVNLVTNTGSIQLFDAVSSSSGFVFIDAATTFQNFPGAGITADGNITIDSAGIFDNDSLIQSFSGDISLHSDTLLRLFSTSGNGNVIGTNVVDIVSDGNLQSFAPSTVSGDVVSIEATGGGMALSGSVTGTTSISITQNDQISNGTIAGGLNSNQINLTSTGNSIGLNAGSRLTIDAVNLTLNTVAGGQGIFVSDPNGVILGGGSSSATGTFDVLAAGSITTNGSVGSGGALVLNSTAGSVLIGSAVTAGTSATITGNIDVRTFSGGVLTTNGGNLTLNATTGSIGIDASTRFQGNSAGSVILNAGIDAFYNENGGLQIDSSTVGNVLDVTGTTIFTTGAGSTFTADVVNFSAPSSSLLIGAGTIFNVGTSVSLSSQNSISPGNIPVGVVFNTPQVNLTSTNGNIGTDAANRLNIDAASLTANAPNGSVFINDPNTVSLGAGTSGALNTFDVQASNGDLDVDGDVDANDVFLRTLNGSVNNSATVTGNNSIAIISSGNIVGGLGTLSSNQIDLTSTGGSIGLSAVSRLTVDAVNLTLNGFTGVFVFDPNSVNIGAGASTSGGAFDMLVQNDLTTSGTISGVTTVLASVAGDVTLGANTTGTTSLLIDASTGDISQTGGSVIGPNNTFEGNNISIQNMNNGGAGLQVTVVGGPSTFAAITSQDAGTTTLNSSGGVDISLFATNGAIATGGNITITGTLSLTTNNFTNANTLQADTINIQSNAGSGLNINGGGGTLTATGLGGVNITATDDDLNFFGAQTFNGTANLTVNPFETIIINVGANVVGNDTVNLNTCNLVLNGTLVGNPINLNCGQGGGTIANSTGDVNLTSDIIVNGSNIAIIASGSINAAGITMIDLSSVVDNGGELTMIAGFNFTPATGGQVDFVNTLFTMGAPSAGGSINLGGVTINTSSSGVGTDGGSVLAVANNGTVSLGAINTGAADGIGGSVDVIAENGITLNGNTTTVGAVGSGDVYLDVSNPVISGGSVLIGNGSFIGPGFFDGSFPTTPGDLSIDSLDAGDATVTIFGGAGLADTITANSLVADTVFLDSGLGSTTFVASQIANLDSTSNGLVQLQSNVGAIDVSGAVGTQDLDITSNGSISISAANLNTIVLNQTSAAGSIDVDGNVDAVGSITFDSAGDINSLNGQLTSTAGDINLDAAIDLNIADSIFANAGSVTLTAGNNLSGTSNGFVITGDGDVTLTATTGSVTVLDNTPITSNNGDVTLSANTDVVIGDNSVLTADGSVSVASTTGSVTSGTGSDFVATNGFVDVTAGLDINIASVDAGSFVNLLALLGSITTEAVTGGSDVFANADGDVTFNDNVNALTGFIDVDAVNGSVTANGTLNALGVVQVDAGTDITTNGTVGADAITLTAGGAVTATDAMTSITGQITIAANGGDATLDQLNGQTGVDVTSSQAINIGGDVTASAGFVNILADGDVDITANVAADSDIGVFSNLGSISITGTTTSTNGGVTIFADLDTTLGGDAQGDLTVQIVGTNGSVLTADLTSVSSDVFVFGGVDVATDALSADGIVDAFAQTGDLTVNGDVDSATDFVALTANNDVSISGQITADGQINIQGFNGNVDMLGPVTSTNAGVNMSAGVDLDTTGDITADGQINLTASAGIATIVGNVQSNNDEVNIAAEGDVSVNGDVDAANTVDLFSNSASVAVNGNLTSTALDVLVTAAIDATINGAISAAGGVSVVGTTGDVDLVGTVNATANNVFVFAGGLVTVNNDITAGDQMTLAGDNVDFAGSANLTAINGIGISSANTITGGAGITLNIDGGTVVLVTADIQITNGTVNVDANTAGGAIIMQGIDADDIDLSADASIDATDLTAANDVLLAANTVNTFGDVTSTAGDVNITANQLNLNGVTITAQNDIVVNSEAGSGLVVDGGGGAVLTATTGTVNMTATDLNLDLFNQITFNGDAFLTNSPNNSIVVNTGAVVTGNDMLTLNTCSLILQGTITGNPLVINCPAGVGTIANSTGDVDLTGLGPLVFNGAHLAIIASGSVLAGTETLIDLSNAAGDGGELTVIAGFDFLPATVGQVNFDPGTFDTFTPNLGGGDIDFTNLDINVAATGATGNGGVVRLIANGGTISTGFIDASSASAVGGTVEAIASDGIAFNGIVDATGATGDGLVAAAIADPVVAGNVFIANGTLTGGGSFIAGTPTAGNLAFTQIDAGTTGTVLLLGGLNALDTITGNNVTAQDFFLNVGAGSATFLTSDVTNLSTTSAGTVTLQNETGDIALSGTNNVLDVTASNDILINTALSGTTINLDAANNITQTATGTVSTTGTLTININNGTATLDAAANNIASLDTNVTGTGTVSVDNAGNDIAVGTVTGANQTLNVSTTGTLDLTQDISVVSVDLVGGGTGLDVDVDIDNTGLTTLEATQGDLTIVNGTGSVASTGQVDLINSGAGNIVLNDVVSGATVGLTTTGGDVTQSAAGVVTATSLFVALNGGTPGDALLNTAANNVGTLNGSGGGLINLNNGANALNVAALGGAQNLTANTTAAGGVTFTADITTTGDVNLTTDSLTNGFDLDANSITVQSNAGSGLSVDGLAGGTFNASGAGELVSLTATMDDMTLFGDITFVSEADLSAINGTQTITVDVAADVTGQQMLTLHACDFDLQGSIVGNPLVFDNVCGGTIANSLGDVTLTGNIIIIGTDVAIIAANNINAGPATTIDLSNLVGAGGTLTMIAGFDFTPGTGGQVIDDTTTFTIGAANPLGGSINLGAVSIDTSGSTNGGNVVAIARGGTLNDGDITIGPVDTSGAVNGGNITAIGSGNIDIGSGAVNTTGGTTSGNVTFTTADPTASGTVTILNGTVLTGSFVAGANTNGTIEYGAITAGNGTVTLSGDLTVLPTGTAFANTVVLNSGVGVGIDAANRYAVNANNVTVNVTGGGDAFVVNNLVGAMSLNASSAVGGTLDVLSGGNLAVVGALNAADIVLETSLSGAFSSTGALNGTNSVTITTGTTLTNAQVAANLFNTPTLNLVTMNGASIGASGTPFQIGATVANLTIDTLNNGGADAFVRSNRTTGINLGASGASGDLSFLSDGALTVTGDQFTLDGDINITGTSGVVAINAGVDINANSPGSNGNIFIGNAINGGNKKTDMITFGANSSMNALAAVKPGGNITVQLGPALTKPPKALKEPNNVDFVFQNGGTIVGGKSAKPFDAGKKNPPVPVNTLTADGAQILISNSFVKKNLTLGGGVTWLADPPAPLTSAAVPTTTSESNAGRNVVETQTADLMSMTVSPVVNNETTFGGNNSIINAQVGNDLATINTNMSSLNGALGAAQALTIGGGAGNAQATSVNAVTRNGMLQGVVSAEGEDNSYMVSYDGPTAQAEASICSDSDLGINGGNIARTAHSDRVVLKKGNVLFVPFQDTVVETPHGLVNIQAKSVALVSASNDKLAVYDLEDQHKGSISISAHGHKLTLAPGQHVTVAHEKAGEFAQVNAIEAIPHRNVASRVIKSGVKVHSSEFSIASAIQSVKPLKAVVGSSHPQAKKVAERLMKTTAILLTIGGNGGNYQHYFKPAVTAMAQ